MTYQHPLTEEQYKKLDGMIANSRYYCDYKKMELIPPEKTLEVLKEYFRMHGRLNDNYTFKVNYFRKPWRRGSIGAIFSDFTLKCNINIYNIIKAVSTGVKKKEIRVTRTLAKGVKVYTWNLMDGEG